MADSGKSPARPGRSSGGGGTVRQRRSGQLEDYWEESLLKSSCRWHGEHGGGTIDRRFGWCVALLRGGLVGREDRSRACAGYVAGVHRERVHAAHLGQVHALRFLNARFLTIAYLLAFTHNST